MTSHSTKRIAAALVAFCIAQSGRPMFAQSAHPVRLDKGTKIALDLDTPINSGATREGDAVLFRTRGDIKTNDRVAIPRGTPVKGTAIQVTPAFVNGKPRQAEVRIRLDEIPLKDGSALHLDAEVVVLNAETAIRPAQYGVLQAGTGAMLSGGMLGGLLGRSSMSAGIGAAAAIGIAAATSAKHPSVKGSDVDLPRDSIFETRLTRPLDVAEPALLAGMPSPPAPPQPTLSANTIAPVVLTPVRIVAANSASVGLAPLNAPTAIVPTSVPKFDAPPDSSVSPPPSAPVEASGGFAVSLDVNRVLIDAVVRDRTGKPMANLRKEDFRLFEDGVEQPIQDFSRDELPLAIALVIDRSGSVAPLMDRIQNAAFEALQQLKREDEVCLISFAAYVQLLEELTTDRQRVANHIGAIRASGGTAIVDAVDESLRYLAQTAPNRRRAVILISDNQEGRSYVSMDQAIQHASETDAVVYSVKIGQSFASNRFSPLIPIIPAPPLPKRTPVFDPVPGIARATGGEIFATTADALRAALASAITRLKLRYTLSINPTRSSTRAFHSIEVRLADPFGKPGTAYTIHSRSGYFSGPAVVTGKAGL